VLVIGFALAVAGALLLALVVRGAGLESNAYALGIRPVSNLIDTPNWFSLIVALLAGVVGVVSLTEARSSTLIGVFISVTTIPAASDIGVSVAFGSYREAWGIASSTGSERHRPGDRRRRRTPGTAGRLAADRPGHVSTARSAENGRLRHGPHRTPQHRPARRADERGRVPRTV